ncbi:SRPBCC family protein [Lichenifustis flavocetrariae]|uniref:SRPBCC domain-containing protein n=1 Tax=Lichenifustis flavocetrariae TaxID=2949735 RepID=A0AA42CJU5_9HYPH|nr:SRPBCC domain-containing protein [Lichenifustis flavocetrariae]MCW6508476.1 SRPBCC domain-containing protein [Lichenifustis flavocetrariae]
MVDRDAPPPLIITRDFNAPRELVWRAWTQPDAIIRWHGPKFYPAAEVRADVRVGGAWRACLKSGNAEDVVLWQSGRYLVITPPERLEFTFAWETPNHEDGPGVETHVTVRLEELSNGGTRMHFSQTGFLSTKSAVSHSAGWNGTFDRLAKFLLDGMASQPPEILPAQTLTRVGSASDGGPAWAKCA